MSDLTIQKKKLLADASESNKLEREKDLIKALVGSAFAGVFVSDEDA